MFSLLKLCIAQEVLSASLEFELLSASLEFELLSASLVEAIDRFHLTSRRPYWCTKTMKWRPYWCTVRELALSYSNISYCFTTPLGPPIT